MRPLNYALIGATGIGGTHLAALKRVGADGAIKLIAAADPAFARMPELRASLAAHGAVPYLDYLEMLRNESRLDVVVVAAPIPFHFEMVRACLERKVFVLLEKPPVPLIQQLEALVTADREPRVGVGFQMILAHWVRNLKIAMRQGKLGEVREIRIGACWPRLDGYYGRNSAAGRMSVRGVPVFDGPATNALAHLIHNVMYLAGAQMESFDLPVEIVAELYRARAIESYDVACLRGKLQSGIVFTAALTHATEEILPFQTDIRGTRGWARVGEDGSFESSVPLEIDRTESQEQLFDKMHRQFQSFAAGTNSRPATSLADARGYVLATNGMLLSSGGIRTIEASRVRRYVCGEEGGYDVAGLREAVAASLATGKLFSELGLPWAAKTGPISVEKLQELQLPGATPAGS